MVVGLITNAALISFFMAQNIFLLFTLAQGIVCTGFRSLSCGRLERSEVIRHRIFTLEMVFARFEIVSAEGYPPFLLP